MIRWTLAAFLLAASGQDDFEKARKQFPPEVTMGLLTGRIPAPAGFDDAIAEKLGKERLEALRSGKERVEGRENDLAAVCLVKLGVKPESVKPLDPPPGQHGGGGGEIKVKQVASSYPAASGRTSGFFKTGQDADIVLSAIDFNQTGGPLLFNHPMGIAADENHLLVADTYNNRVLVWNKLPTGNTPPDVVLGQKDFTGNDAGSGRDRLNFPVNVATDGMRILVTDTENDRILIWNRFPEKSGVPADVVLDGGEKEHGIGVTRSAFHWPWGVWTNGERVVVTSTRGGGVLIWNRFPTQDNQPADLLLKGGGNLGTPRTITSDGKSLIVGDHNPRVENSRGGSFFWKSFPTADDQPYDFFKRSDFWLRGCFAPDGKLLLLGQTLEIWNSFPKDENTRSDLAIRSYDFRGGDHTGVAVGGGRVYVVTGNTNKVVVYNAIPTKSNQKPDFAIGAPDIDTDTLQTNYIISNPVPASNGKNLFVASDFDRKLYVWKKIPDKSGAHPDLVYSVDGVGLDIALWKETLVLAGNRGVVIWKKLPLEGNLPDVTFTERIGSVRLQEARGVALDDRYFYLSNFKEGKIYVWKGIPSVDSEPAFSLEAGKGWRLSSDGTYFVVATGFDGHRALVYKVAELGPNAKPVSVGKQGWFNMVPSAMAKDGHFFAVDGGWGRVHVWSKIEDALAGKKADVLIGATGFDDTKPEVDRNSLHYPSAVCFDGAYLWVGETKFSERLLRFSPQP